MSKMVHKWPKRFYVLVFFETFFKVNFFDNLTSNEAQIRLNKLFFALSHYLISSLVNLNTFCKHKNVNF